MKSLGSSTTAGARVLLWKEKPFFHRDSATTVPIGSEVRLSHNRAGFLNVVAVAIHAKAEKTVSRRNVNTIRSRY